MEQNLANSIILPPKNGGLKAWSHSVTKANWPLTVWNSIKIECKFDIYGNEFNDEILLLDFFRYYTS